MVLMDGLMQRVSTAEDDFQEMPLDKAGRLIASLARNATYEKRVRADLKKKAELAFDQMEAELMAAIKQHPELAGELHDVLARAREGADRWRRLTSMNTSNGSRSRKTVKWSQTVTTNGNFFSIMLSEVTTSPNVGRSSSRTSRTGKS